MRKLKKLNVTVDDCTCDRCGAGSTYTYEKEDNIYPNGTYDIKFYEVEWITQDTKSDADAVTANGYYVCEGEREEITCKQWVDTWSVDTHCLVGAN